MGILHWICCGLDVHKDSITACLIVKGRKTLKTFGTTTEDLLALLDWLLKANCMFVAMESTGVYWKPIYNILEAGGLTEILVVNARDVKAVPGRKTDITDAEWIADLYRHGLLRGSRLQVEGTAMDDREFVRLLQQKPRAGKTVAIWADRHLPYERVVEVLALVQGSGSGGRVRLAVLPRK